MENSSGRVGLSHEAGTYRRRARTCGGRPSFSFGPSELDPVRQTVTPSNRVRVWPLIPKLSSPYSGLVGKAEVCVLAAGVSADLI